MITIAELLEEIISITPFLEEALADGIINLSALSRKVQPQIEKELMKQVSESAILMSLKRLLPHLEQKIKKQNPKMEAADITVRSGLSEFSFLKSPTLMDKKLKLLHELRKGPQNFVTITHGIQEMTTILNTQLEQHILDTFKGEKLLKRIDNLAAITIRLTDEMLYLPGVHYNILKQLAWQDINVIEVVSTYTEFNIILKKEQVDRAFSILLKYLSA